MRSGHVVALAALGGVMVLTACSAPTGNSAGQNALLTGNGSPAAGQADSSAASAPAGGSASPGACLLGANGADVEVGIAGPTDTCATWISNLAANGLVWYPISQLVVPGSEGTSDGETMQETCDLTNGPEELYVEDAGGQINGDGICSSQEQNGWTPESSAGPLAAQVQQQAQVQASESSAAAQQQAQQEQAQQISQAQQSLSSDISTLQSDSGSLNTNTQLGSDVNQMKTDYGTEQADYQTEQAQGSCSDGTMGSDAAQVSADSSAVGADLSALQADIESLQGDGISGIQADISAVNTDLSTLRSLGASPGTGAPALAAGAKAIRNASAAVTWANGQGNAVNSNAQQLSTTASNYESRHGC